MMRLLLLCLLLPTATAYSEDGEDINGSGDDPDDEDFPDFTTVPRNVGKATGEDGESDQMTVIVIVVAVAVVAFSVAAVIAILLIRRHMHKQQQGIYTVPMDQDKKEAV